IAQQRLAQFLIQRSSLTGALREAQQRQSQRGGFARHRCGSARIRCIFSGPVAISNIAASIHITSEDAEFPVYSLATTSGRITESAGTVRALEGLLDSTGAPPACALQ